MIIAKKNLCWFFDLDDTLHDASNGPLKMIDVMMTIEIQKLLKVDKKKADEIRKNYWKKYFSKIRHLLLKEFTLKDTKVLTVEATLDTSVGNSTSLGFKPYTEGYSGKSVSYTHLTLPTKRIV